MFPCRRNGHHFLFCRPEPNSASLPRRGPGKEPWDGYGVLGCGGWVPHHDACGVFYSFILFIHSFSPSFPPFSFPSSPSLLPTGSPAGKQVYDESGELVCTKPFPSMPTHFWNDEDGIKYTKAYFSVFQGESVHQIDQFELLS